MARKPYLLALSCCLLLLQALPLLAQARRIESFRGRDVAAGEVIVRFRAANPSERRITAAAVAAEDLDVVQSDPVGSLGAVRLRAPGRNVAELIQRYAARADVEYVEPNYIVRAAGFPNDLSFAQQWALANTGQVVNGQAGVAGADIHALQAWGITPGSHKIVVAVIDSTIDTFHPDLIDNIWTSPADFTFTIGGVTKTCPAGSRVFSGFFNPLCFQSIGAGDHGTHVAGIIGATGNNGFGVTGVSPSVQIMSLSCVDDNGNGTSATVINCIEFAIQAKAAFGADADVRVLNASWNGSDGSRAFQDEINLAGNSTNNMLFVTAAGNEARNIDTVPTFPAAIDADSIIAVTATDNQDHLASFANIGVKNVDIAAPGVGIYSTTHAETFATFSGTSSAAAMVSGAAALVLSACPTLSVSELKATLLAPSSVDILPALAGKVATGGRLNVLKALQTCGAAVPAADFRLNATAGFPAVTPGNSIVATISLNSIGAFADTVNLSVKLPSGFTGSFASTTLSPAAPTTTLMITPGPGAASGNYVIGVTGTANGVTRTTGVEVVNAAPRDMNFTSELNSNFYRFPGSPDTYLAYYSFISGARTTTIDVSSTTFDTMAYILDLSGNVVASNHGGGGGFNSRITAALPEGKYFLQISNFVPGMVGFYSVSSNLLILTQSPLAAPLQNTSNDITLTGAGFTPGMLLDGGDDVTFSNFTLLSSTSAKAKATVSGTASLGVHVFKLIDGLGTSNTVTFSVIPALPILTSVSPASGPAGSSINVVLTGNYFYPPLKVLTQYLGPFIEASNVVIESPTRITATVNLPNVIYLPLLPSISIWIQSQGIYNLPPQNIFLIPPPPAITSIEATNLYQGVFNSRVVVHGTNLFQFYTVNAGPGISKAQFLDNSTETIQTILLNISANAAAGPRSFSLTTPGGTSNEVTINVLPALPPPTLVSISKTTGNIGQTLPLLVTGTNFAGPVLTMSDGSGDLVFNNVVAVDANTLTASLFIPPSARQGIHNLTVSNAWGTSTSIDFNVLPPKIVLSSISPATLGPGMTKDLTFSGQNYKSSFTINISPGAGISELSHAIVNSQTITASFKVDANVALGPRTITLIDSTGTSEAVTLNISPPPVLTSITPTSGKATKTYAITLAGSGFLIPHLTISGGAGMSISNITNLTDNSLSATLNIVSSPGAKSITVTTDSGTSNAIPFQALNPLPSITTMSSTALAQGSVRTVGLTGVNFVPPMTINTGTGVSASNLIVAGETDAIATLSVAPDAVLGPRAFTVTTADGTGEAFTVTVVPPPPVLSILTPARAGDGSTVDVSLTGDNFYAPLTVDAGAGVSFGNVTILNPQTILAKLSIAPDAPTGTRAFVLTTQGGVSNVLSFTVDPPSLTVSKTGNGNGSVASNPAGIDCGASCSVSFTSGQVFALTATAAPGSVFAGWSGDADCLDGRVTMTAAKSCVARFDLPQANSTLLRGDYDGDGKTDIAVYRPSTGEWFLRLSMQNYAIASGNWYFQWGVPDDVPLSGDFDGDGKSDIAVYRPSTGEWYIRLSTRGYAIASGNWYFQWGQPGDVPITGDFDADGKTDIAVYRPSTGEWYLRLSTQNYVIASGNWYFQWGQPGDLPIAGDFDGDGKADIAVYRPSSGEWYLRLSTQNYAVASGNWYFVWGVHEDQPIAGDFDGDRKTDIAVYRPSTGEWYLRLSSRNYAIAAGTWYFHWGIPGDLPLRGDFDGDLKADIAVYRPDTGEWFLNLSTRNYTYAQGNWYFQWGVPGDIPFRR